jgi:integrase/recombinase XerD
MTISVYTRHTSDCPKKGDKSWRRCRCPKWLYAYNAPGDEFRQSAKTRSWEKAELKAREVEQELAALKAAAEQGVAAPKRDDDGLRTIEAAVDRYIDDKKQQGCSEETIAKVTTLFQKQFLGWTKAKGLKLGPPCIPENQKHGPAVQGRLLSRMLPPCLSIICLLTAP